ncbi:unnamed protein product, partial [Polarella glacialis]
SAMPVGSAAAAATGARRGRHMRIGCTGMVLSPERKAEMRALQHKRAALKEMLVRYDADKSGKLAQSELATLLTDLDLFSPKGTPPSDDEISFIMKVADQQQ